MDHEVVNVCNCFNFLPVYCLLFNNITQTHHNCQNYKNIKLFGFLRLNLLTNLGNMKPIHVEENFKNVMNESEIALVNERSEDERSKV